MTQIQKFDDRAGLPAPDMLAAMLQMSEALFRSGLLPQHIKNAQAAFAVMQKGRELGIPPMYSMSNITVISGKPTTSAELMLALIYRDHGDGAIHFTETTNDRCTISYARRGWATRQSYSFTMQDAKQAEVASSPTWKKYPAAMLRARCISAVARLAFPDSIAGMYTPEELGAQVTMSTEGEITIVDTGTGEVIEEQPAAQPPNPATESQLRLIFDIARKTLRWSDQQIDKACAEQHGVGVAEELTKAQASQFIDWLRTQQPALPLDEFPGGTTKEGIAF